MEKVSADVALSPLLKNATLVRAPSTGELFKLFGDGKVDVVAIGKPGLYAEALKHPGSRVLEGRILVEPVAMGVPKGREAAASYIGRFVEQAKSEGVVKAAIERAALRGVVVAPVK